MPTEKTQPSCPGSRDLNWTGKGLTSVNIKCFAGLNQVQLGLRVEIDGEVLGEFSGQYERF
jgi:hypothetical protein